MALETDVIRENPEEKELALWEKMGIHRDWHDPNGYAIRCGYVYPISRIDTPTGKPVFRFRIRNKYAKDAYKIVNFVKKENGVRVPVEYSSGTLIRPLRLMESYYFAPDDKNRELPIFTIILFDWEVIRTKEQQKQIEQQNMVDDYSRDLIVKNLEFSEDELPF